MATRTNKSKGIVSWPQGERPRERLLSRGAQALTDAELVAILLRLGFKGTSAVELGRQLLQQFGSLRAMVEAPVIALLEVKGLEGAKAADMTTLTVDRSKLISTVKNHSQRHDLDNDELELAIRQIDNPKHDPWQLCNGHDLVGILSIGLRRALGSQSAVAVGVEEMTRALRLAYESVDFAACELYRAIREWEHRNRPFGVLSPNH